MWHKNAVFADFGDICEFQILFGLALWKGFLD